MVVVTCGAVVCRGFGSVLVRRLQLFAPCFSPSVFSPPLPHSFDLFASLPACCVLQLSFHSHAVLRAVGTVGAFIGIVRVSPFCSPLSPSRHPLLVLCRSRLRNASAPGKEKGCKEERKNGRLEWWRTGENTRKESKKLVEEKDMWLSRGWLALMVGVPAAYATHVRHSQCTHSLCVVHSRALFLSSPLVGPCLR